MAPWSWFQQLVEMNKTTLKRVELYESETVQYSKGWMYLVLSACTNLATFRCYGYKDSTSGSVLMPTSSISLADYQLLASLTLPLVRISATSPSIARCLPEILPHCPYLEEISFDDYEIGSNDDDNDTNNERLLGRMLTAIDRHCSMIKKVEINPQPSAYETWHPTTTLAGLQSLSFQLSEEQYRDNQWDQILTSFIERHHTTLGRISIVHDGLVPWKIYDYHHPRRYLQRLSELDIPSVRDLCIAQQDYGCMVTLNDCQLLLLISTVHSIVQRCHPLEYLQLTDCFNAEVLQTIANKLDRQRLRVLRLVNHKWDQCERHGETGNQHRDMAIGSLCRVFDHTMKLLSIVDLDMGPWVDDRVLKAIGRNDRQQQHVLARLRLGRDNNITSNGLLDFAKDMQQSQLTHLSIDLRNEEEDGTNMIVDDILAFKTLPYLANVDISANCKYNLARSTFARFFAASRNAARLKISYTAYDGANRYYLVYTCSGMDQDARTLDIQYGPYTYKMHIDLHGDVVSEDSLALYYSSDGSD